MGTRCWNTTRRKIVIYTSSPTLSTRREWISKPPGKQMVAHSELRGGENSDPIQRRAKFKIQVGRWSFRHHRRNHRRRKTHLHNQNRMVRIKKISRRWRMKTERKEDEN